MTTPLIAATDNLKRPSLARRVAPLLLVAASAFVMGVPTLGGGFVGGDDHRLVLNHVLVNRPSLSHAIELFTISHRDLYQPLPLLSFQFEFAIASFFGLFERGIEGGAWLFHFSNMVLHAMNAVLVWFVVRVLHERFAKGSVEKVAELPNPVRSDECATRHTATIAAMIFAIHPIQAEVVAWTNGRMMLLSTMFALASVLAFASFLDRPRPAGGVLTLLFVLLCSISKIRVGLAVLLLVVAVARGLRVRRSAVVLWSLACVVIGAFVIVNVQATSGAELFSEGAEHLRGPRVIRVGLALAWYFQHLAWPVGLASYYPTSPMVSWSDPETLWAAITVVPVTIGLVWASLRSRLALLACAWFFSTLVVTLPIVPARNILAADRYMYLPIIGLAWWIASAVQVRCAKRQSCSRSPSVCLAAGAVLAIASIAMCWHVSAFYSTALSKTQRVATLFPDTPRVWEPVGWTHYSAGEYEQAKACAEKELRFDAPVVRGGALQLLGMCAFRMGDVDSALRLMQEAADVDPRSRKARQRLATIYDELGRLAEALPFYEAAAELAPGHIATLEKLALAYQRLGRTDDARATYGRALAIHSKYAVVSAMGLAELDIAEASDRGYRAAEERLAGLLAWMPDNAEALTNLGVARAGLGRVGEAAKCYADALEREPNNIAALMNLGQIHFSSGDMEQAALLYDRAISAGLTTVAEAKAVHDFLVAQGSYGRAVQVWQYMEDRLAHSEGVQAWLAWSYGLAGMHEQARSRATALLDSPNGRPLALATLAYIDFVAEAFNSATASAELLDSRDARTADARRRLLGALERFDSANPGNPWTFCLTSRVVLLDGNTKAAEVFAQLCEERCTDDVCRGEVAAIRDRIAARKASASQE